MSEIKFNKNLILKTREPNSVTQYKNAHDKVLRWLIMKINVVVIWCTYCIFLCQLILIDIYCLGDLDYDR